MSKKSESKNIRKSSYRRLFRVLLFLILGLLVLLIITSTIFYTNKDKIAENILLSVNKKQEGELRFRDIAFNPFVHFPSISIQLNDVQYFEIKEHSINASFKVGVDTLENNNDSLNPNFKVGIDSILGIGKPIARFQYLYGSIDIIDLIKGDINISKVMLKNGEINIVKYPDSTFNYSNAIASTKIDPEIDTSHIDNEGKDLSLLLDKISLDNVQIAYYDSVEIDLSIIQINALKASLEYLPDLINTDVDVQLQLVEFGIARKLIIKDKTISITSFLNYNRTNDVLKILTGTFGFEEAIFNFSGMIDFKDKGYIDMEIDGSDRDFGFSKLFLSETGLNQIKNGNIYFNGIVKGKLTEGIPVFDFSFGIEDVDVNIPSVNSEITKINLAGQFNSGIGSDFSQAKLSVKNLTAQLPGGYLNANCTIENFVTPDFTLDWDMKADVTGFEDIFRLEFMDSLGGHVSIKDHLIAKYDPSSKWIVSEESYTVIQCDSLAFNIPGVLNVNELSGAIIGDNDTLRLENLKILTGNTDLMIDGEVYNLISLFLSNDQNITSNLSIQSNIFDLAELLAYDPRVGDNFPYQIVEIDLLLHTITSATQLTDFYSIPEINFEIRHLDAIIQDFLPPISISKGSFKLHEREERLLMNFNEFDIEMAGADINADVEYYSPSILPDYVNTKTKISGLIPGKLFYDESADSIPEALSGILNGSLICELTLSIDTNIFDKILVDQGDLIYETSTDTISINSLFLKAENVIYDLDTNDNPLATLSSQCIIKAQEVNIDILEFKDIQYELDIQNGEYFITPQGVSLLEKRGRVLIFLDLLLKFLHID